MGIMAYSLLWVMQDFVHQPNHPDLNIIQISITRSLHRRRCTALPFSATRNLKREQPERLLMAQLVRVCCHAHRVVAVPATLSVPTL